MVPKPWYGRTALMVAVGLAARWARVAAQEDGVADAQASEEATCSAADHSVVVELIGDTHARLDITPLNVRVVVGYASKQAIVKTGTRFGEMARCIGREAAAGNHHAVVKLSDGGGSGNESGRRADSRRQSRVIERGVEDDHVSPGGVIGNDY